MIASHIIKNHKWQCECGTWVGEDYFECPLCIKKRRIVKLSGRHIPKEEDYKEQIKNECVGCGGFMQNTFAKYIINGNYCPKCVARINKNLGKNKKRAADFKKAIYKIFEIKDL